MTELHVPRECDRNHGYGTDNLMKESTMIKVPNDRLDQIIDRLYRTHTVSSSGTGRGEPMTARDTISKTKVTRDQVRDIIERLYKTHTKAMQDHPEEQIVAKDTISKHRVDSTTLDQIIERMYVTHTTSSKGGGPEPAVCDNSVARKVESPEEIAVRTILRTDIHNNMNVINPTAHRNDKEHIHMARCSILQEIFHRLRKTHTKSSAGGEPCKPWDRIKPPGHGLKMLPPIEGIEIRFAGIHRPAEDEVKQLDVRMMKTQTKASQARLDNPRILLYPERTTLCNNVERIRSFQSNGTVAKQAALERREKWFN